jgi:hypothetical protein
VDRFGDPQLGDESTTSVCDSVRSCVRRFEAWNSRIGIHVVRVKLKLRFERCTQPRGVFTYEGVDIRNMTSRCSVGLHIARVNRGRILVTRRATRTIFRGGPAR